MSKTHTSHTQKVQMLSVYDNMEKFGRNQKVNYSDIEYPSIYVAMDNP